MRIAVLGCGNMATPIIRSIYKKYKNLEFFTYTPSQEKAISLANDVSGTHVKNLSELKNIDYWFIACKPQQFDDLAKEITEQTKDGKVISIMAAIGEEKIRKSLQAKEVFRLMPNTPIAINRGISLYYSTSRDEKLVKEWMNACGLVIECKSEKEFDQLMTVSGSGPGYIFYLANLYYQELIKMGRSKEESRKILVQLFLGSALLMEDSTDDFDILAKKVTSKGGVTEAALNIFEQKDLASIVSDSLIAALDRSNQLSLS